MSKVSPKGLKLLASRPEPALPVVTPRADKAKAAAKVMPRVAVAARPVVPTHTPPPYSAGGPGVGMWPGQLTVAVAPSAPTKPKKGIR
jgi:hypothetical protein